MFSNVAKTFRGQGKSSSVPASPAAAISKVQEILKRAFSKTNYPIVSDLNHHRVQEVLYWKDLPIERENLVALAQLDDSGAMLHLGVISYQERDCGQAIYWYKKAVSKKNPEAMYRLAQIYQHSGGSFTDKLEIEALYKEAAALNHLASIRELASEQGLAWEESKSWYLKAAELGDGLSLQKIGEHYQACKAYQEAYEWYLKSASLGHATACRLIAELYCAQRLPSQGEEKSSILEISWYIKGVVLGDPTSWYRLRNILDTGLVPSGYENLVQEVIKTGKLPEEKPADVSAASASAVRINSTAQAALKVESVPLAKESSSRHAEGSSAAAASSPSVVVKEESPAAAASSPTVALKEERPAAAAGPSSVAVPTIDVRTATFQQGVEEYKKGSYGNALTIFQRWDRLNISEAAIYLGDMYSKGQLVGLSGMMAVEYYKKAAKSSSIPAMRRLGDLYEKGLGEIKPNLSFAIYWYTKAANSKCIFSIERLMAIYAKQKSFEKVVEWAAKL